MTYAFSQQPSGDVMVKLYAHVNFDDPSPGTYPIKRQPPMGIIAYISDGAIYVQEFESPFTLRLTDINSNEEVFSTNVLLGQTTITIPQNLNGDYFLDFDFSFTSYRGEIHL